MLEHLSLFLGTKYNYYMIRFRPGYCDFITINGYAMLVNTLPVIHKFNDFTIAVSPEEFQKILMFEGDDLEFNDLLQVGANGLFIPIDRLSSDIIPNIDKIFSLSPVNKPVSLNFLANNFNLVANYCTLIGITEFKQEFTGANLPTIISSVKGNWKIYLMPLEG